MNEVIKLYENAEPDRNCNLYKHFTECPMKHTQCEDCENFVYPPFTAEKQLELIKWLAKRPLTIDNVDDEFEFSIGYKLSDFGKFEESLAEIINNLWQDLTDAERKQIKEILE